MTLDDEDPLTLEGVLLHLYRLDYVERMEIEDGPDGLKLHAQIYMAGDKYFIPSLSAAASQNFRAMAARDYRHCLAPEVVNFVYGVPAIVGQELRDNLIDAVMKEPKAAVANPDLVTCLTSCPEMLKHLLVLTLGQDRWHLNSTMCLACNKPIQEENPSRSRVYCRCAEIWSG